MKRNRLACVACSTALLWNDAFAYVDPGTGTLLIQWLFGMVVAGFAVLNIYWQRAKGFLSRKFGSAGPARDADGAADEAGRD